MLRVIEIVAGIWDVVISVIIFSCMLTIFHKEKINKKIAACMALMGINVGFQLADLLAWIFRGDMTTLGFYMTRISNFAFFIGMAALPLAIGCYTVCIIREQDEKAGKHFIRCMTGVSVFMIFVIVINLFNGWLYRFDELNQYYRTQGPMLYVFHVLCYLAIVLIHVFAWMYRKCENTQSLRMVRFCCIFAEISAVYQSLFYGISLFNIAVTAGLLFIFLASLQEQTLKLALRNEQLEKSRESLMETRQKMLQLQIRPHFLFNSMAAIQAMILENQELAYESVGTLSTLLRSGIHFSQVEGNVTVDEELNFLESYTQLESLRFGDELEFDFDIQTTGFTIPPFTIQPLVENAINHGLRPLKHKGTVFIRTYEGEKDGHLMLVIEVEDNGVGMAHENLGMQDGKQDHIGMNNVRQRVEEGCKGSFEVISPVKADVLRPGTLIRIRLPKMKS